MNGYGSNAQGSMGGYAGGAPNGMGGYAGVNTGAGLNKKKGGSKVLTGILIAIISVLVCGIAAFAFFVFAGRNNAVKELTDEASNQQDADDSTPVTKTTGDPNADSDVTILIYMIGSTLEYNDETGIIGLASVDVQEMLDADIADSINVVIEAGGAKKWNNTVFSDGQVDRAVIKKGQIQVVENLGKVCMSEPGTLSDFIDWGVKSYPAKRYQIVFWDHGGGVVGGFGEDSNYPDSKGMYLSEMKKCLDDSGIHFELISFNACLMATVEAANVFSDCADYMIASEESVWAASGLNYTNYFNTLSENPDISTEDLGISICENYTFDDQVNNTQSDLMTSTLSLIKLSEVPSLMGAVGDYFGDLREAIKTSQGFSAVYSARFSSLNFGTFDGANDTGTSMFDEIDLMDFVGNIDNDVADRAEITRAFKRAVKYNGTYSGANADGAHGLSVYVPGLYAYVSQSSGVDELKAEGLTDSDYLGFVEEFANISSAYIAQRFGGDGENTPASENSDTTALAVADEFWAGYDVYQNVLNGGFQVANCDGEIEIDNNYQVDISGAVGNINNVNKASCNVLIDLGVLYLQLGSEPYDVSAGDNTRFGGVGEWYEINGAQASLFFYDYATLSDGTQVLISIIPAVTDDGDEVFLIAQYEEGELPTIYKYCGRNGYNADTSSIKDLSSGDSFYLCYPILDLDGNLLKFKTSNNEVRCTGNSINVDKKPYDDEASRLMSYLKVTDNDEKFYCSQGIYTKSNSVDSKNAALISQCGEVLGIIADGLLDAYDNGQYIPADSDSAEDYHNKLIAAKECAELFSDTSGYDGVSAMTGYSLIYSGCKMIRGLVLEAESYGADLGDEVQDVLDSLDVDSAVRDIIAD